VCAKSKEGKIPDKHSRGNNPDYKSDGGRSILAWRADYHVSKSGNPAAMDRGSMAWL